MRLEFTFAISIPGRETLEELGHTADMDLYALDYAQHSNTSPLLDMYMDHLCFENVCKDVALERPLTKIGSQ